MGKKLIITAALCGAGTTKKQTPCVPITPEEIAADAVACAKAGAGSDPHPRPGRERRQLHGYQAGFCQVVDLVREECGKAGVDPVLNLTTSGSKWPEDIRRAHLPILKPEMCSYDPGTMNWANSYIFSNSPAFLEQLGHDTQELGIKPECEIFDGGMMGNVDYYVKKGVLKGPIHYQFVLGVAGGMRGNADSLAFLLPKMQPGSTWSITGIGRDHMPCMLLGLAEGCDGLRVGLEDNILMEKGVLATNVSLVERAVKLGELAGRSIAAPDEAREILGLTKHI